MLNFEADEAGKLRAFRERFGRGWDAEDKVGRGVDEGEEEGDEEGEDGEGDGGRGDTLMDLISGFGREAEGRGEASGVREGKEKSGKRKGGER